MIRTLTSLFASSLLALSLTAPGSAAQLNSALVEFDAGNQGWSIPETLFYAIRNDAISSGLGDKYHTRLLSREALTGWGYEHALASGRLAVLVNRHTSLTLPPHADIYRVPAPAPKSTGAKVAPE